MHAACPRCEQRARHLARTYGTRAFNVCKLSKLNTDKIWPRFGQPLVSGYPYIEAEVEWACKEEYCRTVADMLTLRTRLAYLNSQAAIQAAPRVAQL